MTIALFLWGCHGDEPHQNPAPDLAPGSEPGVAPLLKLSTTQYQNTVGDLLAVSSLAVLQPDVQPFLDSVPADSTDTFRGLDARISTEHVTAFFNVARTVGDAVEADAGLRGALAGPCATEPELSAACTDTFLRTFGRRVYRRPLATDELARYAALDDDTREPPEAIRAMVVSLLLAPEFLNHVEVTGLPVEGADDLWTLSPFEVASKLSYTFWQTMPDAALLDAAESGALATDAGYAEQVERVFADPRTEDTLFQFWNEWFRLERFTGFSATRPAFQTLAAGEHLGEPGHDHYADMVEEIALLTSMYTWDQAGTLAELLTTQVSVTASPDLAHLYGVPPYTAGSFPLLPAGERTGLLQRSALLASSLEQTNPFHRGAFVRRYLLCDPLPPPDPSALPPGSLDPPPVDPNATTRERFDAKVADNQVCQGCHGSFSDIGYVLEAYDALGRYRETELVLDEENGDVLNELPIDTVAVAAIDLADTEPVADPAELNARILESGKMATCLSKQYFSYALRRPPSTAEGDQSLIAAMAEDVPLAELFREVALHPSFRLAKGAP